MKEMRKISRRRQLRPWTAEQVNGLYQLGLLKFVPEPEVVTSTTKSSQADQATVGDVPSWLDEELNRQVKALAGRRLSEGSLKVKLKRIIDRICRPNGVLDASLLSVVSRELCSRLGLSKDFVLGRINRLGEATGQVRGDRPISRAQLDCFLEWIDIPHHLWTDSTWRKCLRLKFGARTRWLVDCLPTDALEDLDRCILSLKGQLSPGDFTIERIRELIKPVLVAHRLGIVSELAAIQYARVKAADDPNSFALMYDPLDIHSLFLTIARYREKHAVPPSGSWPKTDTDYFLRYLMTLPGHQTRALWIIIYMVAHLSSGFETAELIGVPKAVRGEWPLSMNRKMLVQSPDYRKIADLYSDKLRIPRRVFDEVWMASCSFRLRESRWKRQSADSTVFWAARLLEAMDIRAYNAYCIWVDDFQSAYEKRLVPTFYREDGFDEMWAHFGPASAALSGDPLLNCVFHSEVLQGRKRLTQKPEKPGPDYMVENRALAYAHRRLQPLFPAKAPRVDDVLGNGKGLSDRVRSVIYSEKKAVKGTDYDSTGGRARITIRKTHAKHTGAPSREFGPSSLYSYLAPLAEAMLSNERQSFTPRIVQERCLEYADDPEVLAMERNLMDEVGSTLVGK